MAPVMTERVQCQAGGLQNSPGLRGATEPWTLESKTSTPPRTELSPGLGHRVQQPGQRCAAGLDLAGCVVLE